MIEAYHEGKLSEEEKVEFEVRLLVDEELQEENTLYKKILFGFHDIKAEQIRLKLRQIDNELDRRKKGKSNGPNYYWLMGLAATLAIVFFFYRQYITSSEFTAELIPADAGLPVLMGSEGKLEFDNAMSKFKAEAFEEAGKGFEKALAVSPENDTTLFYLANAYLRNGKYAEATSLFSRLSQNEKSAYRSKSQFYLALSYWAEGNLPAAKQIFETIAETQEHSFQSEATQLVKKLQ
ncbi:MAG: Outer rane lipoprotein [Bacteroidota bacterium]